MSSMKELEVVPSFEKLAKQCITHQGTPACMCSAIDRMHCPLWNSYEREVAKETELNKLLSKSILESQIDEEDILPF